MRAVKKTEKNQPNPLMISVFAKNAPLEYINSIYIKDLAVKKKFKIAEKLKKKYCKFLQPSTNTISNITADILLHKKINIMEKRGFYSTTRRYYVSKSSN